VYGLMLAIAVLQAPDVPQNATAQDSAYANEALARGLVELEHVVYPTDRTLPRRFIRQLDVWGERELAWRIAARTDTAGVAPADRTHYQTVLLALKLFTTSDTLVLDRRLSGFTQPVRDRVLESVSNSSPCNSLTLSWLVSRIRSPMARAQVLARSGASCGHMQDTASRKRTLRAAVDLIRADTTTSARSTTLQWLVDLRSLGEAVTTPDLLQVASPGRNRWQAQYEVARLLVGGMDHAAALPLLDSVLAALPQNAPTQFRIQIYEMRGTRADSAVAKTLRDSIRAASSRTPAGTRASRFSGLSAQQGVWIAINRNDQGELAVALNEALHSGDTVEVLIDAAVRLRNRLEQQRRWRTERRDSLKQLSAFLLNETMRITEQLTPVRRDSTRLAAIVLITQTDIDRALQHAESSLSTPRFRDRALAGVIHSLANTDADRAERLAVSLEDPISRDLVYPCLVERAIAGGRLSAAAALAERVAGNRARVRSQVAIAAAEVGVRRHASAKARISAILPAADPSPPCNEPCVTSSSLGTSEPERDRAVVRDLVLLSFRYGLQTELADWARTRETPEKRAAAWLALAEAKGQELLHVHPDYGMF